jgi:hypothetical protein
MATKAPENPGKSRLEVPLDPEIRAKLHEKASALGLDDAAYVRVASAIGASPAAAGHEARRRELTQSGPAAKKMVRRNNVSWTRRAERYGTPPLSGSTSLRLNAGRPDHLAPFLGFVGNELAEVGRRTWRRSAPPNSARRPFIFGSANAALISLLSFSTISAGVPLGAPTPHQELAS